MNFHGLVDKNEEEIESKNLRALVRKIKDYREFLDTKDNYEVKIYDIGDGIAVARKLDVE